MVKIDEVSGVLPRIVHHLGGQWPKVGIISTKPHTNICSRFLVKERWGLESYRARSILPNLAPTKYKFSFAHINELTTNLSFEVLRASFLVSLAEPVPFWAASVEIPQALTVGSYRVTLTVTNGATAFIFKKPKTLTPSSSCVDAL